MIRNLKNYKMKILILTLILLMMIQPLSYAKKKSNYDRVSEYEEVNYSRDIKDLENEKVIMITFDDGPHEKYTIELLDELKKRDAKVTFFMIGNKIELYPDIVKRAYKEGHTVSNHSYSHKNLRSLKKSKLFDEIDRTNKLLDDFGIENHYLRPPYGFSNNRVFKTSDMSLIYWDIDPMDWKYKNADKIYNKIVNNARDGAIVLVHDTYSTSIEGAIRAIDELLEEGYAIISLEEAEKLGYIDTDEKKEYYSLK